MVTIAKKVPVGRMSDIHPRYCCYYHHHDLLSSLSLSLSLSPLSLLQTSTNRQQAQAVLRDKSSLFKLFEILAPRYAQRQGGYTRVMKLQKMRRGDSADMSVIG